MQGSDKNTKEEQTKTTRKLGKTHFESIFSQEEIRDIVKKFVSAWLRGDITISFVTSGELLERAKMGKQKLSYTQAYDKEVKDKLIFTNLCSICVGAKQATEDERQKAISDVFELILVLRSSGRIKGKFIEYDIEERLRKLEERLDETDRLVHEIAIWLRSQRKS